MATLLESDNNGGDLRIVITTPPQTEPLKMVFDFAPSGQISQLMFLVLN